MKKRLRELRLQAEECWPNLRSFVAANLHPDWPDDFKKPIEAIAEMTAKCPVDVRKVVLREWRDWNSSVGAVDDVRPLLTGLGVHVFLKTPLGARHFMNSVYDRLIESVRSEYGRDWKP